ncbi:hypothetical protein GT50_14280 [Geobacillus stearothermophilus 10]|nr:hypothetical protein GT50_14280 [Geobacillus stearothermophilus 10]
MMIRPIEVRDAENFLELCKKIDESGFMLFEPGERQTTVEQQSKSIERMLFEPNKMIFVAETENKLVGFLAVIGGDVKRNRHSANVVLEFLKTIKDRALPLNYSTKRLSGQRKLEF